MITDIFFFVTIDVFSLSYRAGLNRMSFKAGSFTWAFPWVMLSVFYTAFLFTLSAGTKGTFYQEAGSSSARLQMLQKLKWIQKCC